MASVFHCTPCSVVTSLPCVLILHSLVCAHCPGSSLKLRTQAWSPALSSMPGTYQNLENMLEKKKKKGKTRLKGRRQNEEVGVYYLSRFLQLKLCNSLGVIFVLKYLFGCGMWAFSCGMWDPAPRLGIEPGSPAPGAWSPNHLTTKEVSTIPCS